MPVPNALSTSQLYRLIGTLDCPVILDIRTLEDFDDDPRLIPTAIKRNFDDINLLVDEFRNQRVIIYCQKGLKISQGCAALLRDAGFQADFLEGGQFAWRDAGLPMIAANTIPPDTSTEASLWVTRHRPKIDRIACPWLIRRFVDTRAKFLFVEPKQVMNVAARFGATPFDVDGATFSHKGDLCSFDAMLGAFGIETHEPLANMANIVRAADTDRNDLAPEAAGLLAVSVGLSRLYRHDLEQLEAGMLIYDALYRWARDAHGETHSHYSSS